MTEALWIVVIVNLLAVLSVWIKAYFDYKAKKALIKKNKTATKLPLLKNPGPVPGESDICKENRDIIVENKTNIENIEENIKAIFRILDKR